MKGIIWHWTGGGYKASTEAREAYHAIIEGDGTVVTGNWPISANEVIVGDSYAAHTRNSNTGFIGISIACMAGAKERPLSYGKYPPTKKQIAALVKLSAKYCRQYRIPVSYITTLSHAEVEANLGIKQRGKWDITVLPWLKKRGALVVGNYLRSRVKKELEKYLSIPTEIKLPTKKNANTLAMIVFALIAAAIAFITSSFTAIERTLNELFKLL